MLIRYLLLLFAITAIEVHAQDTMPKSSPEGSLRVSETSCPWLNQGSAAKVLASEVSLSVQVSDANEGMCVFSSKLQPEELLKIEVSKTASSACGADSAKLKGLGNEAMRCKVNPNTEMISGRVRDLYFAITLKTSKRQGSMNPASAHEDTFELIAEQVTGNLF
jgi:hypothetical protein